MLDVASQEVLDSSHEPLSFEPNENLAAMKAALHSKQIERERLLLGHTASSVEAHTDQYSQDEHSIDEKGNHLQFVFATAKVILAIIVHLLYY